MDQGALRSDLLALLKLVHQEGSTVCVGTCEHRKPNELHCHGISNILKISSAGAKSRLRELVEMGLMKRERTERDDGKVMAKYTVTEEGVKALGL